MIIWWRLAIFKKKLENKTVRRWKHKLYRATGGRHRRLLCSFSKEPTIWGSVTDLVLCQGGADDDVCETLPARPKVSRV